MGEKQWLQDFETGLDRLRVHFYTTNGKVVAILVVQYEAYVNGEWCAIVRYDEARGFFHRDVLSPTGKQTKTPGSAEKKDVALTQALDDLK
jgi:hypothetical protein